MTRRFSLTGLLGLSTLCGGAVLVAFSPTLTGCGPGGSSATPTPVPTATPTPVPPSPTRIVFVSNKTTFGNKEIYSVTLASGATPSTSLFSGAQRHITDGTIPGTIFQDQAPTLSRANTNEVAFQSDRFTPGQTAICLLDLSTNSISQITTPGAGETDTDPTWSPDGTKIAFARLVGANVDIYVFNRSTSITTRITNNPGIDKNPAWSHNGTNLAFASNRASGGGDFDIYTASPNGLNSNVVGPLTLNSTDDEAPKWSPFDDRLIYQGKIASGNWAIFSISSSLGSSSGGSAGLFQHTTGGNDEERPCYSPDGQNILFQRKTVLYSIISQPTSAALFAGGTPLSTSILGDDTQPGWGL